ncbi:hypothetical protein BT96DRAFT_812302, partial [Gymnopus androsaceus JB14]
LFCCCPKIGIQPFTKTICNLTDEPFKPHMSTLLSTAFDIYCTILKDVYCYVQAALGCNEKDWQMLNSCPPCQY